MGADRAAAPRCPAWRTAAVDLPAAGVNAIFYLLQAGCQCRMLPRDFPPRSTVYGYFRAWIAAGVWARVHDVLYRGTRELEGREESPTVAIIDRCRNGRAKPGGEVGQLSPMMTVRARSATSGLAPSTGESHGALCRD
jgi:transposase